MKIIPRKAKQTNRRTQQQSQVKRLDFNPRLLTLGGVILLLAVAGYATWLKLMDPRTLPLKQVELEAPFSKVSKQRLHEVLNKQVNGGFFSLDVAAVTRALDALPWVRHVEVRRVWPDTLHVTVTEQVALARWRDQALVNVDGELFYPDTKSFPANLVELNGPEGTVAQMAEQFHRFNETLKQGELAMRRINLSERRAWEVELNNSTVIVLGRDDMAQRLERFVRFYPQLLARATEVRRVDMRYTNGFAVQWRV
jgi:cell division protein FtsQ